MVADRGQNHVLSGKIQPHRGPVRFIGLGLCVFVHAHPASDAQRGKRIDVAQGRATRAELCAMQAKTPASYEFAYKIIEWAR